MIRLNSIIQSLILLCPTAILAAEEARVQELASNAGMILERHCVQCHRGPGSTSKSQFDVRIPKSMIEAGVIVAGDAKNSLLWELPHRGTMPPRSQPQLSRLVAADAQIIADWIQAGAPAFPTPKKRQPISLYEEQSIIAADLRRLPDKQTRVRQRYFSFAENHNNPAVSNETLHLSRVALVKALNSLSWERELVFPRPLNDAQTLFAIDIEKLGWTREHWRVVRARYPYGLGFENLRDSKLRDLEQEIQYLTDRQEPLISIRSDWFVTNALQPFLYHSLLYDLTIPELKKRSADQTQPANPKHMTALDLERHLGVDVIANFPRGEERAMRAGFTSSGVSAQNRMLERHGTSYGAYWKSYDFLAGNRRSILSQFPLGPKFQGNQFEKFAFEHDGGEIIFSLPNGLHGYLLINGKDQRIDAGPIEVVSDALKTSGSPLIQNAISCVSCHKEGLINSPADEIRDFSRTLFGAGREQLLRLYSERVAFDKRLELDRKQFLLALETVVDPVLKQSKDQHRSISELPEPISELVRQYIQEELSLTAVAAELREPDLDRIRAILTNDTLLQDLGLAVLLRPDGKIKRAFWESRQGGATVMQLMAFTLGYSTPQYKN